MYSKNKRSKQKSLDEYFPTIVYEFDDEKKEFVEVKKQCGTHV